MKKLFALILLLTPCLALGADNRGVARDDVANRLWTAPDAHRVRFTTTTASPNAIVCLVGTMTATNLVVLSTHSVSYSPTITSSTTVTYGGRSYMMFQVVGGSRNVHVDYSHGNLSTTNSPYLTVGQWYSSDDPVAHQGPVFATSIATFTVTGWIWFDRAR